MIVAKIRINGAFADTEFRRPMTAGLIGAQVQFSFDEVWEGLAKTAVFQGCVTKDVVNIGETVTIPAEVVEQGCEEVSVGVYGVSTDGMVAIPTVWTQIGPVYAGTDPSGDETTDPSLPVWAQLAAELEALKQENTEEMIGGYYIPLIQQEAQGTMTISFSASKENMEEAESVTIALPAGPAGKTPEKGVDYYTEADKTEMVEQVLAALPVYSGEVEDV